MPINREQCIGFEFEPYESAYGENDVILYNLAVGAGDPPTDPVQLAYTHEQHLKVLPSFAAVAGDDTRIDITAVPGLEFDPLMVVHGEHEVIVHQILPKHARLRSSATVVDVYDKGRNAVAIIDVRAADAVTGRALYTSRMSLFLRGAGGFGGPPGPPSRNEAPSRAPDGVVESRTLPQQALLYRLCGDKHPLHCDPQYATKAGFERPILHGLCSYGIAGRAVIDGALAGNVSRVSAIQARFSGVAYPGETFVTEYWFDVDRVVFCTRSKERGTPILSNAALMLHSWTMEGAI